MCFFDPTDIRERYLTAICGRYSTHTGRSEATLSNFPIQPGEMQLALDELKQKQLISCPVDSLGKRVKDEVRKEILNQLENMPAVFEVAIETAAFVVLELWPSMMGSQKNEPSILHQKVLQISFLSIRFPQIPQEQPDQSARPIHSPDVV